MFAKRRKKADKWVVDEKNIGQTVFQSLQFEQTTPTREEVDTTVVERTQQQEVFQQQSYEKQQQSKAMRQRGYVTAKCIGKEVATKYFLPGDLKLNLFWLGFPNYL